MMQPAEGGSAQNRVQPTKEPDPFEQWIQPSVRDAVMRIEGFRVMEMMMCRTQEHP